MAVNIDVTIEKIKSKSRKTGNDYEAYKLSLGDYETLLFPKSNMERNYLDRIVNNEL